MDICRFCRGTVPPIELPDQLGPFKVSEWRICEDCESAENDRAMAEARRIHNSQRRISDGETDADFLWKQSGARIDPSHYPADWYQHPQMGLFLEGWGRDWSGMYIWGGVGTGKTLCAIAAIRWWCANKLTQPMYIEEVKMFQLLRDHETKAMTLRRLQNSAFLVIDDLGRDASTEYSAAQFYNVIDERYRQCMPTVLVSNFYLDDLAKESDIIDARTHRRIRQMCLEATEFLDGWWKAPPNPYRPAVPKVDVPKEAIQALVGGG